MVQHHLDLQQARCQAENAGWQKWLPGNLLPKGIAKRPDAIAEEASEQKVIAVELERSIKTKKRYEIIFSTYFQSIKRGEYTSVHYVCLDPEFAKRLRRMFQLIEAVPVSGQRVLITDKHHAKFLVYFLQKWPPLS